MNSFNTVRFKVFWRKLIEDVDNAETCKKWVIEKYVDCGIVQSVLPEFQ